MSKTKCGWRDPGDNVALKRYLHSFRRQNFLIGGRGLGKSVGACKKAELAAALSPGIIIMITEQTAGDIEDILIPAWEDVTTPGIWRLKNTKKGPNYIASNGSEVWMRTRHAKNHKADPPFRGPTVGGVIHDEIALDIRVDVLNISQMMLRQKNAKMLFCDGITTPKPNWLYYHLLKLGIAKPVDWEKESNTVQVSQDGAAAAFYGRTKDNRFNRDLDARMRASLSKEDAEQELDALWVIRHGRCWNFVESDWPNGNLINSPFNPNLPYIIGCDLGGADSAWGLYQLEKKWNPQTGVKQELLVLKAEWTPQGIKPFLVLNEVKQFVASSGSQYREPIAVHIGADYKTPGTAGDTAEHMFQAAGWGRNVHTVTGYDASKDVQDRQASFLLHDSLGNIRFCVSRQLKSFYTGPTRGIIDMLRNDTYPEAGGTDYFRKEKSKGIYHEDTRDQFLYTCIGVYPPEFRPQSAYPTMQQ